MTAKAPQPMPEGVDRTNRPKAPSAPPNKPSQPQSYADMFQQAYWELQRLTDAYFKQKQKEFDKYLEDKIKERLGE